MQSIDHMYPKEFLYYGDSFEFKYSRLQLNNKDMFLKGNCSVGDFFRGVGVFATDHFVRNSLGEWEGHWPQGSKEDLHNFLCHLIDSDANYHREELDPIHPLRSGTYINISGVNYKVKPDGGKHFIDSLSISGYKVNEVAESIGFSGSTSQDIDALTTIVRTIQARILGLSDDYFYVDKKTKKVLKKEEGSMKVTDVIRDAASEAFGSDCYIEISQDFEKNNSSLSVFDSNGAIVFTLVSEMVSSDNKINEKKIVLDSMRALFSHSFMSIDLDSKTQEEETKEVKI